MPERHAPRRASAGRLVSRLAWVLAPLLLLSACDQAGQMWDRLRGEGEPAGEAPLEDVPLAARAISGSVQAEDGMAALLAPEPVRIVPGQILVGARLDDRMLASSAEALGLERRLVRAIRNDGAKALDGLSEAQKTALNARAAQDAAAQAQNDARLVLERLGVQGAISNGVGGVVKIDLNAPRAQGAPLLAQLGVTELPPPAAMEWNEADACPGFISQDALETDLALATRCAVEQLRRADRFAFVEPNYIATAAINFLPKREPPPPEGGVTTAASEDLAPPNDPLLSLQWHFRARGEGEGQSRGGAGFERFWARHQTGSQQVRVAVIDSGIDLDHPDIRGSRNVAAGVDLISDRARGGDGDGVDDNAQDDGDACGEGENSYHGTHVAGLIGAASTNDRVGVAGGAWAVTVVPVRVLGRCGGELADIAAGVRWAAGVEAVGDIVNRNPADIINLSFTLQAPCPGSLQAAIDAAVARGAVVVAAAGNKADQTRGYAPANCNNVIVVAANDARGELAFYSNFGPEVDVVAPGGDMFADSDGDTHPDGVLSTRATRSGCYDPLNRNSTDRCYYSFLQGTSLAAPHVSAALALLASETGLRGQALEAAFFQRAVSPAPAAFGQIECARARNAVALGGTICARPGGRGYLDLARAAASAP